MAREPLIMRIRAALSHVENPATGRSIIAEGLVSGLSEEAGGVVRFTLETPGADRGAAESLLARARAAAESVTGVSVVKAVATAHGARAPRAGGHDNPLGVAGKPRIAAAGAALADVKHVIAVASGKGGVGKSTLAANLAVALARRGLAVGLLDADIYGPSAPTILGLREKPVMRDGRIAPLEAHGVRAMSIGLLVDSEKALAWRGPMVMGAVRQLLTDVDWGALDILIVDTPPGTGDAHLSLAQAKILTGAIIVSTPQELALADMRRGVELFHKTGVEILGVVENMAWFETPDGARHHIFGAGGAERAARELDAPFLVALPILPGLREASDAGRPPADGPAAQAFDALAQTIVEKLTAKQG